MLITRHNIAHYPRQPSLSPCSEREKQLAELWKAKTKYVPGEWNTQSVLLNGLARAPELPG